MELDRERAAKEGRALVFAIAMGAGADLFSYIYEALLLSNFDSRLEGGTPQPTRVSIWHHSPTPSITRRASRRPVAPTSHDSPPTLHHVDYGYPFVFP